MKLQDVSIIYFTAAKQPQHQNK